MTILIMFYLILMILLFVLKSGQDPSVIIPAVPKILMNDGNRIPIVGYGTWNIVWDKMLPLLPRLLNDDQDVINAVVAAVKTGYRHIDTAYWYNNEPAIGKALKILFREGVVKRDDLFITTKVWCNYHSRRGAIVGLRNSVRDLGIDFVDLALIHFPEGCREGNDPTPIFYFNFSMVPRTWRKDDYLETWRGMEDAQRMGWTRSIGVANFDTKQLKKIINNAKIKPAVNQVECNPYYQQKKMIRFCKDHNIIVVAYSPLRQAKDILRDPVLVGIAKDKDATAAQVALKWNVQRGVVVIPKSVNPKRMAQNLNIFDFELTDEEMREIDRIRQKPKQLRVKWLFRNHPDLPDDENY